MDHVAIDLGGRESQVCVRRPNNDVALERRIATAKLKDFFSTLEPSRVILETCAEAFAVARDAKAAGHDVRVSPRPSSEPSASDSAASRPTSAMRDASARLPSAWTSTPSTSLPSSRAT